MKPTKKSLAILGMALCFTASQICCAKISAAEQKTKITLNHSRLLLQKGKKATLRIKKGLPKETSKNMIIFQSSNKKVASVDTSGKISAKKAGNAKITVKIKGKKLNASCNVKIVDKLKQISLKSSELTIKKGEELNLTNFAVSSYKLAYSSDDKDIVKVSSNGVMQGIQAGVTTVAIKIKDSVKEPVYMNVKVLRDEYDTPLGFDETKDKIPHGSMTEVSYPSTVTGKNLNLFDYYGIFSPAPTTDANLMGTDTSLYPKVIWLSVGTSDTTSGQMAINTDAILTQKGIDHIYYRMPGAHEWSVWKNGFYNFTQLIFK